MQEDLRVLLYAVIVMPLSDAMTINRYSQDDTHA